MAEIDSTYKARIAEKELFLQGKIREAGQSGSFEEVEKLEKQLATEIRRLHEDCEEKKGKAARELREVAVSEAGLANACAISTRSSRQVKFD